MPWGMCSCCSVCTPAKWSDSVQVLGNHMGISDPPNFQQMMSREVALLLSKPVRARCASEAAAPQQRRYAMLLLAALADDEVPSQRMVMSTSAEQVQPC